MPRTVAHPSEAKTTKSNPQRSNLFFFIFTSHAVASSKHAKVVSAVREKKFFGMSAFACQSDERVLYVIRYRIQKTMAVETIGKKIRFGGRKVLKSLARPEGFEPPTLRIRRTIKAPTHKDSCRKEVGNSSHKCRVRPAARASIPPSPSQSGSNLVAPCYHDSTKRRSFQATKRAVGTGWMS
jgi:hypothetical protein